MEYKTGKQSSHNVILFYTDRPRFFISLLIGHLYELCQKYSVLLVSEPLDQQIKTILANKSLFPKLEKIIPINQYENKMSILKRHRFFSIRAKQIIENYRPSVVIAPGMYIFESYLKRYARKYNIPTIGSIPLFVVQPYEAFYYNILINVYTQLPYRFIPNSFKIFLTEVKKKLAHFLYYVMAPILTGNPPFIGELSCILLWDILRLKGADYFLVFNPQHYTLLIKQGVSHTKLRLLIHPYQTEIKLILKTIYNNYHTNQVLYGTKKILILWPDIEIAIKENDFTIISKTIIESRRKKILQAICALLPKWTIIIKPHPEIESPKALKTHLLSVSSNILFAHQKDILEHYIELCDVIVGMPPPSTGIFTATYIIPEKPILFIDIDTEFLSNYFKEHDAIEYITTTQQLNKILSAINNNTYHKETKHNFNPMLPLLRISDVMEEVSKAKEKTYAFSNN